MEMETPQSAGVYCRLSYSPDGSLEKVERQEADCRELAARLGWPVFRVYPDNSRSAWKRGRKRPAWDRMLEDLDAGVIDGIIVYHGDRLIRQPWDLELLLQKADDRHLPLASPSGTRDLNSEDDRFILRIEAAQACRSSADTSRRVQRDNVARAERGAPSGGGNRPFGYGVPNGREGVTGKPLYDLTQQNPEEAPVGAEAVRRFLAGQSQGGVIAWMNTVSTTTNGNRWTPAAWRSWVQTPRIAGLIEHKGTLVDGNWEGIITPEQREDVLALIKLNQEEYGYSGRERVHLCTGTITCSSCSTYMWTKPVTGRAPHARQYYCKNPACENRMSRNMRHVDEYVIGRALRRLNEKRFIAAVLADTDQPGVGAEITALERRKTADSAVLADLANHPEIDTALLVRGIASYDTKIAQLRAQLQTTTRERLLARMAGITREQWDLEPIDIRAATVHALFTIEVLPVTRRGPGFDPDSVQVRRRA